MLKTFCPDQLQRDQNDENAEPIAWSDRAGNITGLSLLSPECVLLPAQPRQQTQGLRYWALRSVAFPRRQSCELATQSAQNPFEIRSGICSHWRCPGNRWQ